MRRRLALHRDLGLQLFALYLLLIVPFLITLWIFDGLIGERIRADVQASDLALAQSISQEVDLAITKALGAVEGLSAYPGVIASDNAEMGEVFRVIYDTTPDVNLIYRLDTDGIMVYHYPEGPTSTVGVDFSFRDYYQRALQTKEPLVSIGRISPTTNQAVATAVMPLWSEDEEFRGLIGANIRLESLSAALTAILSEHQAEEGLQVIILDSADQIIAHPEQELLLRPATDVIPQGILETFHSNAHARIVEDLTGQERLYTHSTVSNINWQVIVSRPTSNAFATQIILRRIVLVAAGTFVLIGLFFWGALTVRVIRPIERLAPISEAIGLNQPISNEDQRHLISESKRNDQIGHLNQSILRMKDSIEERMKEQATLLETSTAVVSSLDLETVLDQILEQMGRLLQIKMYAIIALDESNGTFRIRASRGLSRQFAEQLSIQPYEPDSVTMRALHAKEPIQVSDTETDPSYTMRKQRARVEGFRAILAVPLNTQHAPPTALLVFHPTPHIFTYNEIQLLTSFANHAAMAIENAMLYERSDMRLREQTHRLEALVQSLRDGLILSDLQGKVIYANKRVSELAALSAKNLAGMDTDHILARIIEKSSEAKRKKNLQKIFEKRGERIVEVSQSHLDRTIHLRLEVFNVNDEEGAPIGRGIFFHDITADRELDRMRSSLVSTVSHELRTPLAAIKGYVSTMLADDVEWDRASQREFLTIISDESDRLTNLVNNLLDLSRIEAGSLKIAREKCDIEEIILRAAKQARLAPGNKFEYSIEAKLPRLYADPPRLETILRNLIENSVKYGGEKAEIKALVGKNGKDFVFRVIDNGPGIPEKESQRVFERFYRVDESLARLTSGAGLGLAICQGLVRAHGGRIWVEPQEKGACIAFTIPMSKSSPDDRTKRKTKVRQ
ncbi:MAG: ATP-binding protein [Anaerolineales bacterium]|nr:ATP-binding protein [Anaerolineales bacterium]NUQ86011.1 GAF domain-containing protein [Anaerolineales bacterium]